MNGRGLDPGRGLGDLERIDLATFTRRLPTQDQPVVVVDVADDWPARELWTHAHLRRLLGWDERATSLALTRELAGEVAFPDVARRIQQANVWIVPDGTVTQLHYDLPHNLNTVLFGEKDFVLFHPRETKHLYPYPALRKDGALNSRVRLDDIEPRFRRVHRARYWRTTVRPGETLYIPPFFWHFVRSRGESVAVNVWFHTEANRYRRIAAWPRAAMVHAAANVIRRALSRGR